MNRIFAVSLIALGCAACAPQSYQELHVPAASGAGYGYSEQRLDERRFAVTYHAPVARGFTFSAGQDAAEYEVARAYEFALARAAEIALANGYTAFRVEDRRNDAMSQNYEAWSGFGVNRGDRVYSMDEAYLLARVTLIVAMLPSYESGAYDAQQTLAAVRGRYTRRSA
jgi:hypothetical protein